MIFVECRRCHQVVPQSWCEPTGYDFEAKRGAWVCTDGCRRSQGVMELGLDFDRRLP